MQRTGYDRKQEHEADSHERGLLTVATAVAVELSRRPGHDAFVMGEAAPSLRSLVFGDEADRVASASVGPVVVV